MDSPVAVSDQQDPDQGASSPSTSEIENFTKNVLERVRERGKLIEGQVPQPLKEKLLPVSADVQMKEDGVSEKADEEVYELKETTRSAFVEVEGPQEYTLKTSAKLKDHLGPTAPTTTDTTFEGVQHGKSATRSTRLTMLARTINEWEDDMTKTPGVGHRTISNTTEKHSSSPAVSAPPPAALKLISPPKSPVKLFSSPMLGGPKSPAKVMQVIKSPPKQDQPAISPSKQVQFACSPPRQVQVPKSPPKQAPTIQTKKSPPKQVSRIEKSPSKAALETPSDAGRVDPCAVIRPGTVSQQRLLFEPLSGRPTERGPLNIVKGTVQDRKLAFEKSNVARPSSPLNRPASPVRNELVHEGIRTVNKLFGNAAKQEAPSVVPSPPPMPAAVSAVPKRPHSPSPATPNSNYPGLSGLKKLRPTPSPPKPGHLYPSLTDIECDTEQEMDDSGESLGCVIEKVAKSATATPSQGQGYGQDKDNTCTVTMAIGSALDALDDALEGEDYTLDTVMESQLQAQASSTPNTAVGSSTEECASGSYMETDIDAVLGMDAEEFEPSGPKTVEPSSFGASAEDPTITSSPIINRVLAPGPMTTPLMHTVSFYRRSQQQQTPSASTSSNAPARKQLLVQEESNSPDKDKNERVNEEIRELEMQAVAQTKAISQASKALNLCSSRLEFADSTERVECERVLLLATNRRSALLKHVQNLRTDAVLGSPTYHSTATLSIGQIRIQAPRIGSQSNPQMMRIHHFILLASSSQNVEASEVVQLAQEDGDGMLEFKGFRLQGLHKDFRLVLELYGMETGREWLSHDAKYRIATKKGSSLTPSKKQQHLHLQSPAGPQAVLSSSFAIQGSLTLVIGDLHKKQFQMTSSSSGWGMALETELQAMATCNVRHSGYLTLFEDVNGLGCWVRRWAMLGGGLIQFWMYEGDAEDENKPPTTSIPLSSITTSVVRSPPPSVCARANSILMESIRDRRTSDKPSLTTELSGNSVTRVKWLLAADSKQERGEWLERLNTVLEEHKRWQ